MQPQKRPVKKPDKDQQCRKARPQIELLEQRQLLSLAMPHGLSADMLRRPASTVVPPIKADRGTVSGQITDASGNPLADARVMLIPVPGGTPHIPGRGTLQYLTHTDANGSYSLSHVLAGSYTVAAHDKGFQNSSSSPFTVAGGDNTAPTVQLTALVYGTVVGQITDTSGNPLANARVMLIPLPGTTALMTQPAMSHNLVLTDADGNYTISNVLAGSYTVAAHDHGYANGVSSAFTVAEGTTTAPTVTLTALAYGTVTGQITDTDGHPLANARVMLIPVPSGTLHMPAPAAPAPHYPVQTDASGNYTIDNVPAGNYTVAAHHKGYVNNTSSVFTVAEGDNIAPAVPLTALVYGTVTGQVTDTSGNPLADARVMLIPVPGGTPHHTAAAASHYLIHTDANGIYTIPRVLAGSYTVAAHDKGYVNNSSSVFTVVEGDNAAPTVELSIRTAGFTPV